MARNGYATSRLSDLENDSDPGFREYNISRSSVGFMGREAQAFGTTNDNEPTLPPFLASNIARERQKRNFWIQDGGKAVFYDPATHVPVVSTKRVF